MNFDQLITSLRELDASLRTRALKVVNVGLSARNWLVGAYVVEFEQVGEDRADYGDSLIPSIAKKLALKGLGSRNLEACRLFYRAYPEIPQTLSAEFKALLPEIPQTVSAEIDKALAVNLLGKIVSDTGNGLNRSWAGEAPSQIPPATP